MHIIPTTVLDAFAKGDILQVLLVSILFGFALSSIGARAKPLLDLLESLTRAVFKVVNMLMRFAPSARWRSQSASTVSRRSVRW